MATLVKHAGTNVVQLPSLFGELWRRKGLVAMVGAEIAIGGMSGLNAVLSAVEAFSSTYNRWELVFTAAASGLIALGTIGSVPLTLAYRPRDVGKENLLGGQKRE